MRNIKFSAWFFFLICLLEGMTTLGSEKGSVISGALNLSDASTNCDRIEVDLERPMGINYLKTYTDWFCNYSFRDLESGTYYLHVSIPGYFNADQMVHLESSSNETVSLAMKRATDPPRTYSISGSFAVNVSEVLNLYPERAVRFYHQSIESRKKGKTEDAKRQLEKAIEIAPGFYDAHNDLGLIYESLGRIEDAADQLWKAHEINRESVVPLINLGALHLATGDPEAAERDSNMAVEIDSHSAMAFYNLGVALYRESEFQRAENALLKTLSLAPSMLVTRLALADVYVRLGRLDDASVQLDQYLADAGESPMRTQAEQLRKGIHDVLKQASN